MHCNDLSARQAYIKTIPHDCGGDGWEADRWYLRKLKNITQASMRNGRFRTKVDYCSVPRHFRSHATSRVVGQSEGKALTGEHSFTVLPYRGSVPLTSYQLQTPQADARQADATSLGLEKLFVIALKMLSLGGGGKACGLRDAPATHRTGRIGVAYPTRRDFGKARCKTYLVAATTNRLGVDEGSTQLGSRVSD